MDINVSINETNLNKMKELTLINNRWVDENNNSWSADIETKESARNKSESLIDCRSCSDCSYCSDCCSCRNCRNCRNCRDCSDCSDYKSNPQRYVTENIGSRHAQTTIYWTSKDDVQIICGCWKGNIEEFEKQVMETHGPVSVYTAQYAKQIEIFKYLVNQ